ncbi:MAG TPA: hypothetical protein VEU08_11635, partial [Vicinamibacterales bacterium]|nr:hypothetical protein [Vicinamibacterales bacterium]
MNTSRLIPAAVLAAAILAPAALFAQGTPADYERANGLRAKYDGLTVNVTTNSGWIGKTNRLWYRRTVRGGADFIVFDAETKQRRAAFDHAKIAASLSSATGKSYTAVTLP